MTHFGFCSSCLDLGPLDLGFRILNALVKFTLFVEFFGLEAFYEDLRMIFSLYMLVDFQAILMMFLLCYTQCLDYLLRTMFPSSDILQYYVEFNTCNYIGEVTWCKIF